MYVFGYGSLLCGDMDALAPGTPARLHGWRRSWGVAMDNTRDLPGYKHYLDSDGRRPALHVAFLDVRVAEGDWLNGLLQAVDAFDLARLDVRERNYRRVEVSGQVRADVDGPVWTYVGLAEARERRRRGLHEGLLVVARQYLDLVRGGLTRIGSGALADFHASTDALPCPLLDLHVVHHPAPAASARALAAR